MRRLALVFVIGSAFGGAIGAATFDYVTANDPVCHSLSEDSDITDCDYRDGAWYSER